METSEKQLLAKITGDLKQDALQKALEEIENKEFTGNFNIRIPKEVHKRIAIESVTTGIPMNTLFLNKLTTMLLVEDYLKNGE